MNTLPHFRRLSFTLLAWALLVGPLTSIPARAQDHTTLFLVRHAEKSAPNGDLPLSAEGRSRAALLASMLRDSGVGRIYTTEMVRTRETAEPLARELRLKSEAVPVQDVDALVARLRTLPAGSAALVVNHSGTIPKIVEKLGGGTIQPIGEEEYDRLLVLMLAPDGSARLVTLRFGAQHR
jgi:broad specificity phosphatase PhoE